ncbi:hypothetical protein [Pseudonocardia sp. ICBG601]|uniref:hypothetical protein n=1 Tax=Pseudonocardia sp. ICBG601 TaxID=2846759 RepID=UPI001CF659D2|nr:hypothetical protein [Pseudonocardia sp. ICBG601]
MTAELIVPVRRDVVRSWTGVTGWLAWLLRAWSERRARREEQYEAGAFAEWLRYAWRDACECVGACKIVETVTGPTARTPRVGSVITGPPVSMLVELIPGQEPEDLTRVGGRLAHSLCFEGLRVVPHAGRWVRIELLDRDPLADQYALPGTAVTTCRQPVLIGRDEVGDALGHAFADAAHVAMQGQNGAGKSQFAYGLLAQLADADDVRIAGSDITGLLLGRPWAGTVHRQWQATGTADLEAHATLLERLVGVMDERLATLPDRTGKLDPTSDRPLFVVVVEEFPGLLRAAAGLPKAARGERSVLDRIKSANLRLLSEGRKVAFRVVTLAQRAEAEAMGGGYARDQYALRLSFRVPGDSLEMLHGPGVRDLAERHATAPPGVAVLSAPGRELVRVRVPYLGDYAEYCDRIARTAREAG